MRQRTPPNSTGTSLSPLSSSYLSRLPSSNDNSPSRTTNTLRFTSPSTSLPTHTTLTKQVDGVALLLKQTIAPAQFTQVNYDEISVKDEAEEEEKTFILFIAYLVFFPIYKSTLETDMR